MSAIWGNITWNQWIPSDIHMIMSAPYEAKCKIDRYDSVCKESVYMGCGIQFITKEAHSEKLPYFDAENNFYLNADALLDNREELIALLNASIESPDGELILMAYKKWGMDCLTHFRGLFSIAVYDNKTKTLYLASDHTAGRCLYYYRNAGQITFSTLIAPILNLFPDIHYNENYLKDYLTAPGLMPNIVSDETPYEGIFKLNPGTILTITENEISEKQYWNPSMPIKDFHCRTPKEYGKYFRKLYSACVKDALRTDGEIGISMSSGFDSASVGALAASELNLHQKSLYTYTYIPYEAATLHKAKNNVMNEQKDVESIVAMYPNMVPHFLNNEGRNCIEGIPHELDIMEIPFKAYVNFPNLCEIYEAAAKQGCKVLLTGQCGNSTVSHGYIDDVLYDLYSTGHLVKFLLYLNHYSKTVKESRKEALKGCVRYFNHTKEVYQNPGFYYEPSNEFLSADIIKDYPMESRYRKGGNTIFENVPISKKYYNNTLYKASMFTYIGEWETKMGLAHGIVIRDATKDMRMLQFCYHLPYRLFAYKGIPRWLIRENLSDLFPPHLLSNWMRYSVQNADYISRINRDKSTLLPYLRESISQCPFSDWINSVSLDSFWKKIQEKDILPHEFIFFDDAAYIYILSLFLTNQ